MPLRIELRRFSEERRHSPEYNFLSYATEVLLKREDVKIDPQMFEILLERSAMLLIFDGLDEVATLNDRKQLVQEIEDFVLNYPGNRVLVTSRPVGYELASCSHKWFTHTQVHNFNDEQIHQFLHNWYTYVLKLPSLSKNDQEELDMLFDALKDNYRLHKLAENPLLLTVITALHRYERLPDKRVLVYDRCAKLLLDTWSRLRGTDARWRDMKMSTDEQYTCVAYLGYVLHDRSQEEHDANIANKEATPEESASDVPAAFLLEKIEYFLRERNLITDRDEQYAEARHFCDLMLQEAGLIVERGTGGSGEPLYGFIHRTFQEYFAAAYIFDKFQQAVNTSVISEFLERYLHDPHWREVILLLLGKLSFRPVTILLQDLRLKKIKSRRSLHRDIMQQDLFFISCCLVEEITVQQELAVEVLSDLTKLVLQTPFPSQCIEALEQLGSLMKTRQYANLARKELLLLVDQKHVLDTDTNMRIALMLFDHDTVSESKQVVAQLMEHLAQSSDLIDHLIRHARFIPEILTRRERDNVLPDFLGSFISARSYDLSTLLRLRNGFIALAL